MRFFRVTKGDGFTLIEVTFAVAIVALLSTVLIASVQHGRKKAHDAQRMSDLGQIQVALRLYKDENDGYPDYPWGATIGEGGELDTLLAPYLTGPVKDPLPEVPLEAIMVVSSYTYSYIYQSDYDGCTNPGVGPDKVILYAKSMETESASNWDAICGGAPPDEGGVNTYGVILK